MNILDATDPAVSVCPECGKAWARWEQMAVTGVGAAFRGTCLDGHVIERRGECESAAVATGQPARSH